MRSCRRRSMGSTSSTWTTAWSGPRLSALRARTVASSVVSAAVDITLPYLRPFRGVHLHAPQSLAHPDVVDERAEVLRELVQHVLELLHLLEGTLHVVHVAAELAPVLVHEEVHRLLAEVFEVADERVLEQDPARPLGRRDLLQERVQLAVERKRVLDLAAVVFEQLLAGDARLERLREGDGRLLVAVVQHAPGAAEGGARVGARLVGEAGELVAEDLRQLVPEDEAHAVEHVVHAARERRAARDGLGHLREQRGALRTNLFEEQ